jgi:hypothetical protein
MGFPVAGWFLWGYSDVIRKTGFAMIVDAENGLAVVSRSVIPFDLGILSLTFAESVIIPGKVVPLPNELMVGGVSTSNVRRRNYFMESETPWRYTSSISPTRDRLYSTRYSCSLLC